MSPHGRTNTVIPKKGPILASADIRKRMPKWRTVSGSEKKRFSLSSRRSEKCGFLLTAVPPPAKIIYPATLKEALR
jgi:hypothetical protein